MTALRLLLTSAAGRWLDVDAGRMAAALSFYSILSLAPFLLAIVNISGLLLDQELSRRYLLDQISTLAGPSGAAVFQSVLQNPSTNKDAGLAAFLGLLTLLWGASSVFLEIHAAIDGIWGSATPEATPPNTISFWRLARERFLSLGLVAAVGFLLPVSLSLSAALAFFSNAYRNILHPAWVFALDQILSLAAFTLVFLLIFRYVPSLTLPWRALFRGSLATALLFALGKVLIGLYLGTAGVGSAYGAAGSLFVFLVWVYYSAAIFLFGAAITWVLRQD